MNALLRYAQFLLIQMVIATPIIAKQWDVQSPNGQIRFSVHQTEDKQLEYSITYNSDEVVGWSRLGVQRSSWTSTDGQTSTDFSSDLIFTQEQRNFTEDRYTLITGKRLKNTSIAQELVLHFETTDGHPLSIEIRAYDDGAAFRYVFPDKSIVYHTVEAEYTEFNLGTHGKLWAQPYQNSGFWFPAYENYYENGIPIGSQVEDGEGVGWAFPALFEKNKTWILLHESGFDGSYHGSQLSPNPIDGIYQIAPPDQRDAIGVGSNRSSSLLPWALPWRFFVIGDNLNTIVSSNRVFDLAAPQAIKNTDWIHPGISSWSWWSDHDSSQNLEALKTFIDLAADMNWDYSLVDANWNLISNQAMEELVDYARSRNVGLLFWYNSGGTNNSVTEQPRNRLSDASTRRTEFAKLSQLGVKGVKIDFFQSDKQFMMQYYLDILKDAAEFELMVDFHGCTIPRGWERTYPNLMTSEAVLGAEAYSFKKDYAENAPWQNTILPFTRNVIGPMDYTPITWTEWAGRKRLTSPVHEVALAIVFESGIQHFADSVAAFKKLPKIYRQFLSRVPTVWDETRYLAGYPGRDVILARRKGKQWFIAGINGENMEKVFELDLSFLSNQATEATLLHDSRSKGGFKHDNISFSPTAPYRLSVQEYGGFVLIVE